MSEFIKALAKAQSEMENAALNKVNPHFKSKYADLPAVRAATLSALNKNGFALIQTTEMNGDGTLYLKTELAHIAGESRIGFFPIKGETAQQQGSSMTYARRYGWASICGIASEEDDDGNEAEKAPKGSLRDNPTKGLKNARQVHMTGSYAIFEKEVRACPSLSLLRSLWLNWQDEIKSWPVQHRELAEEEKDRRKLQLADDLPLTEQLKESLDDGQAD